MTPEELSRLHHAAFDRERAWSAREFADLLCTPHVSLHPHAHGFALTRTVAGESELLTLAVDPAHQRQGIARTLLEGWLATLSPSADRAFLEVAADNDAALSLYASLGFEAIARRPGYYARSDGNPADALILRFDLTPGHTGKSPACRTESC